MNKEQTISVILLAIITTIVFTVLKKVARGEYNFNYVYLISALYMTIPFGIYYALKNGGSIAIINSVWSAISIILTVIIGILLFNENLDIYKKIATGLTVVSIGLFAI